jgi:hypothetical protein
MNLDEYSERLLQETIAAADAEADGSLRAEVFTRLVAERLTVAGEINDADVAFHRGRGVEVSGWSVDEDETVLHLFVTDYRGEVPTPTLTNTTIAQTFKRLTEFYTKCLDGYGDRLEESTPVFELADVIARQGKKFERLRFYLFSDARARSPKVADTTIRDLPVTHHIWDVERLRRLDTSGLEHEPIAVDVTERVGGPLACLQGPDEGDHRVYLLVIPGELLASLYGEFGARLLERNVRAFLQARGAVNKGIRESLLTEPDRFLAYNNGISATASEVTLVDLSEGGIGISQIRDLQVVNGGQTTASIHNVAARDRGDVSRVRVQAKLTVVSADRIDEMVPFISRYSNTQNKVTGADFSANDPFHVKVEELSRSIWAPAADGSQRQTHWFYERARGQFADELGRAGTSARQRQFKLTNPPQQKFTKTDLAKFEHSWEQLPHVVSLGAEKNFREFMLRLVQRPSFVPDGDYFHRLVAKAILFRSTEKIVSAQKFGGYRVNIVTYTIAKLVHTAAHRIDLERVWRTQALTPATADAIAELSHLVHEVIVNPFGRVRHVGEWCKKLDCWKRVEELDWQLPSALQRELMSLRGRGGQAEIDRPVDIGLSTLSDDEEALVRQAAEVPADTWFRLSNWAKETNNLEGWQRSLAYSLGRRAAQSADPTLKQARQGLKMLEEATRRGFS